MIDRRGRDKLAKLLQGLIDGGISAEDLDGDIAALPPQRDVAILHVMERVYDIVDDGQLRGESSAGRKVVERAISFLNTDQEYVWAPPRLPWWIWGSRAMWQALLARNGR